MDIIICCPLTTQAEKLKRMISSWLLKKSVAHDICSFFSSEDLLDYLEKGSTVDALFISSQFVNEMSGVAVASQIRKYNQYVSIFLITDSPSDAFKGYEIRVTRCVEMPFRESDVDQCLKIALWKYVHVLENMWTIRDGKKSVVLRYDAIVLIESIKHYQYIHTATGDIIKFRSTIAECIACLPDDAFTQCHKSYIVNLLFVRKVTTNRLILTNKSEVPIGNTYAVQAKEKFLKFYDTNRE